jgi:hypothetical protein
MPSKGFLINQHYRPIDRFSGSFRGQFDHLKNPQKQLFLPLSNKLRRGVNIGNLCLVSSMILGKTKSKEEPMKTLTNIQELLIQILMPKPNLIPIPVKTNVDRNQTPKSNL